MAQLSVVIPCYDEAANVAPLVARLHAALHGIDWEAIFVDDDSPDGTAGRVRAMAITDARVRCIRRLGRRGLSSAVIEGVLSSSAEFVAVMDGDLQHDETRLPVLRAALGEADIAVASRYVAGGTAAGLASVRRERISNAGTGIARRVLRRDVTDPMSGFFMLRRDLFERLAPRLTAHGFKILFDLLLVAPADTRVVEVASRFAKRVAGESKLDALVLTQFAGVLVERALGGVVPPRFIAFAAVGMVGLLAHLAVLLSTRQLFGADFAWAQLTATIAAMAVNFQLNNLLTYRTQRLRGAALWRGLALFMAVCGLGAVANVGIARVLYEQDAHFVLAGAAGALIGLVWNYAVSATLVWRAV